MGVIIQRVYFHAQALMMLHCHTVPDEKIKGSFTLQHVHGIGGCTVSSVTHSPHGVAVPTHAVDGLHEGPVEAHHPWVTWEAQSTRSVLIRHQVKE